MSAALVLGILTTLNKLLDLFAIALSKAEPATAAKLIDIITEQLAWQQEHIWRPIGEWIARQ